MTKRTRSQLRTLQAAARIQGIPWKGHTVRLAWYPTASDYAFFHPTVRESHAEYHSRALDLHLAVAGSTCTAPHDVPIYAKDFCIWLAARPNTAALRREFIRLRMEGGV